MTTAEQMRILKETKISMSSYFILKELHKQQLHLSLDTPVHITNAVHTNHTFQVSRSAGMRPFPMMGSRISARTPLS
jgi:hypothetical protein